MISRNSLHPQGHDDKGTGWRSTLRAASYSKRKTGNQQLLLQNLTAKAHPQDRNHAKGEGPENFVLPPTPSNSSCLEFLNLQTSEEYCNIHPLTLILFFIHGTVHTPPPILVSESSHPLPPSSFFAVPSSSPVSFYLRTASPLRHQPCVEFFLRAVFLFLDAGGLNELHRSPSSSSSSKTFGSDTKK
ncbi:hypothetical protein PIB30_008069 [Stylosanthes scabra]|uniref:Uncharacterized protein n=1 Tax=Stylosanthes scabra TaxID=79078 RepID=A0ABU6W8C1_9FABA|nr:hypothetical protein [Stylosanthes scabra]